MVQRQAVTGADRDRLMGIDPTWLTCQGCPAVVYVDPRRCPDGDCARHCICDRPVFGGAYSNPNDEGGY